MASLDAGFVLDCAGELPSALSRLRQLRGDREPLYLSVAARAAVLAHSADRDAGFRQRASEVLEATENLDIDSESVRYAAEIAQELARVGRGLTGVELFVAASARQRGQIVISRNPSFEHVPGLVRESY